MIFVWYQGGGVTGDTVLNVMRGIRYAKDKKAEFTQKNREARVATKAADIADKMTLGKATVKKIEDIEDDIERVEAVGNLNKPRMEAMLMMYGNNFILQKYKETLNLYCLVELNASEVLKNCSVA